jgi:hypothetical protein
MRIQIKLPTRERPKKFFKVLDLYIKHLSGKHECFFVISCDNDDESMHNDKVIAILDNYDDDSVFYYFGDNKSKVQACNADIDKHPDFDILVLTSDDMIPQVQRYDDIIAQAMQKHFPDMDGCLWFNDGYQADNLCTLPILSKKYYERFGYVYHPDYQSLWCDGEFNEIACKLGRIRYIDQVIIKHQYPDNIGEPWDVLMRRNNKLYQPDKAVYFRHKREGYNLGRE